MTDDIESYPPEWVRTLDFLPLLGLQSVVDKNLEIFYCTASASVKRGKAPRRAIKTEYGAIKVDPINRTSVLYEKGTPDWRDGYTAVPQKELLEDILENIPTTELSGTKIPDVVLGIRNTVEKIPAGLDAFERLQGSEYLFRCEIAHGNMYNRVREALNIPSLANPYEIIKSKLLYYNIIKSPTPIQLKLRSTLKTHWICTNTAGWGDIGETNILPLELALKRDKWWTDIGIPTPFQIPYNSGIRGRIYQLLREKSLVVV
jgi:hypothetical protein